MSETTTYLFSYGTLQLENVQKNVFGKVLNGSNDALIGFKSILNEVFDNEVIKISGLKHHPKLIFTGNEIDGIKGKVFQISKNDLQNADTYEVADYKRILITLKSGISAWVYVDKDINYNEHQ